MTRPDADMTAVLQTERLVLRPPVAADAQAVAALVGDLRVSRWVTHVPHPYGLQDALDWIEGMADRSDPTKLVCLGGQPIGAMTLRRELGYWFGIDHWGRGYATEAARAVLARHFAATGDPVQSGYHTGNERSANVLRKLGFVNTEVVQQVAAATGETVEIQRMQLTAGAWEAAQ